MSISLPSISLSRRSAAALFAGAVLAATVGAPALAQAAAAPAARTAAGCPSGSVCVWLGINFTGTEGIVLLTGKCSSPLPGIHSLINNTDDTAVIAYSGKGCTGSHFSIPVGYLISNTPYGVDSLKAAS